MNWKLILSLSGLGLAMGLASLFGWTRSIEGPLWLVIGVFCAIWIARAVSARHFLHGFLVGLFGGALAPLTQGVLFSVYVSNNPGFLERFEQAPIDIDPRVFVFISAPIIAILSGVVMGLFTWVAGKLMKRPAAPVPEA